MNNDVLNGVNADIQYLISHKRKNGLRKSHYCTITKNGEYFVVGNRMNSGE